HTRFSRDWSSDVCSSDLGFLHDQLAAWNAHDREAFFGFYRAIAPNGLTIEYVGKPPRDPWEILETMWADHNAHMRLEPVKAIIKIGRAPGREGGESTEGG